LTQETSLHDNKKLNLIPKTPTMVKLILRTMCLFLVLFVFIACAREDPWLKRQWDADYERAKQARAAEQQKQFEENLKRAKQEQEKRERLVELMNKNPQWK
jgi:hypothetical protein